MWIWVAWLAAIALTFAIFEYRAIKLGRPDTPTFSRFMWTMSAAFKPWPFIWGFLIGFLACHFWWGGIVCFAPVK